MEGPASGRPLRRVCVQDTHTALVAGALGPKPGWSLASPVHTEEVPKPGWSLASSVRTGEVPKPGRSAASTVRTGEGPEPAWSLALGKT